jgi:hypothetical protein
MAAREERDRLAVDQGILDGRAATAAAMFKNLAVKSVP